MIMGLKKNILKNILKIYNILKYIFKIMMKIIFWRHNFGFKK